MRMHPRRHGAYNFSARLSSAIVNEHYKNKKKQQKINVQQQMYNNSANENKGDNGELSTGCLLAFVVLLIFFLILYFS